MTGVKTGLPKVSLPVQALYVVCHRVTLATAGIPPDVWLPPMVYDLLLPMAGLSYPPPVKQALDKLCETVDWDLHICKQPDTLRPRLMSEWLTLYERVIVAQVIPAFECPPDKSLAEAQGVETEKQQRLAYLMTQRPARLLTADKVQLLQAAVSGQRKIKFTYQGLPRIGDPYIVGHSVSGRLMALVYQSGGQSHSGYLHVFKHFLVEGMRHIQLMARGFSTGKDCKDDYDPDDWYFEEIIEQV
jgi:hypothetical protein